MAKKDTAHLWVVGYPAATAAVTVTFGVATLPSIAGIACLVFGLLVAAFAVRAQMSWRRSDATAARAELIALATERIPRGRAWLNRDEHVVILMHLQGWPLMRRWLIARASEDLVAGIQELEEGGKAFLTAETFACYPVRAEVFHYIDGAPVSIGPDGDPVMEEGPKVGKVRSIRHHIRAEKMGILYASPEEIRALCEQIRGAESLEVPMED
jgi:hypothetical protein